MDDSIRFSFIVDNLLLNFKIDESTKMFSIFAGKLWSDECEHLDSIVSQITDVQVLFIIIHGDSCWSIEKKCTCPSYAITITFTIVRISKCN